jgi:hypothetical protein
MNQHLFVGCGKSRKGIEVKFGPRVYPLSDALLKHLLGLMRAKLSSDGWVAPAGFRCRNAKHARVVVTRLRHALHSKDVIETSAGEYRLTIPRDRLHVDVATLEKVLGPAETAQLKTLCDNAARPRETVSNSYEDESNSRRSTTEHAANSPPPPDSEVDRVGLGESWTTGEYDAAIRDLAKYLRVSGN